MPKKKTLMETSQVTEVAPNKRSFRTREHMSYPDSKGRSPELAEELSRSLLPKIREAVLHPPKIAKPLADAKVTAVAPPHPDASEVKAETSKCRRCREGKYGGNGDCCNYCGHSRNRPVRKS